MATQVKHRRGTQSEVDSFTGAIGEIVVNTTEDELVLNDGTTQGGIPIAKKRNTQLSFDTLSDAVINTSLKDGYSINLAERTVGNGGGAMWDVVLASTVTPNTYNIVACTGAPSLALVLRIDDENSANIKQWGCVGDGVTDDSDAFEFVMDNATSVVYIPAGTYLINRAIAPVDNKIHFEIYGDGQFQSVLKFDVTGYALHITGANINFEQFEIIGAAVDTGNAFTAGKHGVKITGNLTMRNVNIKYFDDLITWDGGFYHKYYKCELRQANRVGANYNANNVLLHGCWMQQFNTGFEITGGTGPFVFRDGAIELWSGICFRQLSGAQGSFHILNNYFENSSSSPIGGIPASTDARILLASRGSHMFCGNDLQLRGTSRPIELSSLDFDNDPQGLTALENKWWLPTVNNDFENLYRLGTGMQEVTIRDFGIRQDASHTGSFPEIGVNRRTFNAKARIDITDPFNMKYRGGSAWTEAVMTNGWTTSSGDQEPMRYKVEGNILYIQGEISGSASSSTGAFTFDSDIVDTSQISNSIYYRFTSTTRLGVAVLGRVQISTGVMLIDTQVDQCVINLAIPLTY